MSEDYRRGFKDGFAIGLEEGKRHQNLNPVPQIGWPSTEPHFQMKENCPKCGIKISGAMGYVCHSPNCPTFPQVTCGPGIPLKGTMGQISVTSAVGASVKEDWPTSPMGIFHHPV